MTPNLRTLTAALPGWSCTSRHHGASTKYYAERLFAGAEIQFAHLDPDALIAACRDFDERTR